MENVLLEYIQNKADKESKHIWEEKGMSNEVMNKRLNTHIRTPYNQ
jgi:hypothetical protein